VKILFKSRSSGGAGPKPVWCHQCGSELVKRTSHLRPLDQVSKVVGFTTFRCLSCYGRFRVFRVFRAPAGSNWEPAHSTKQTAAEGITPSNKPNVA
jgi:hypothetical protein